MIIILNTLCAGVVLYACFCRLSLTDMETDPMVRFAVWSVGTMALVSIAAPLCWHYRPDPMMPATWAAVGLLQIATRRLWLDGIPPQLLRKR